MVLITQPKVKVTIIVKDKNGKEIKRHEQEARSWLKNFYAWQAILFRLGNTQTLVNEAGNSHNYGGAIDYTWDEYTAARTRIAIGLSDLAWDVSQYKLDNKYAEANVATITYDETNKIVRFSASFSVSESITLKETGIKFHYIYNTEGAYHDVFIERTVLDTPVDVPAGASISVIYTLQWS